MIRFNCSCGKAYQLPDEMAGKSLKCSACQTVLSVPAAAGLAPLSSGGPAATDDLFAGLKCVGQPAASPAGTPPSASPLASAPPAARPRRAPTSPLVWAIAGISGVALLVAAVAIVIMGMSDGKAPQSASPPPGYTNSGAGAPAYAGDAKAPP